MVKSIGVAILACLCVSSAFAESAVNTVIKGGASVQHYDVAQKAKLWGLSTRDYQQYRQEMASPLAARWWKQVDPPQVLGMNASTPEEQMKYATIDVELDQQRDKKELSFQHAYTSAFDKLYPNAKLIAIDTNPEDKAKTIQSGDKYFLFTPIIDPEGALLASKLIHIMGHRSNIAFNIYFTGKAGFSMIQHWGRSNNIPVHMAHGNSVTLNHNNGTLKNVLGQNKVALPILIREREGHSQIVTLMAM